MNQNSGVKLWGAILPFLLALTFTPFYIVGVAMQTEQLNKDEIDYLSVVQSINMSEIKNHVTFFSSLGSRMTGYEGCDAAANYIIKKFQDYGLKPIQVDFYNVTVPIDYGADVKVLSPVEKIIKAYPLAPNMVQTCATPGISGPLEYVGLGELKDFNGKKIAGSIVLMEFNSHKNWLKAAELGAKAVIFIEPEFTTKTEAEQKVLQEVPLHFPRLWISREDGIYLVELLKSNQVTVSLRLNMKFKTVLAKNIIGIINGTHFPHHMTESFDKNLIPVGSIAVSAHYDSFSFVPSLAPGAEDSLGISVLLEMAKYFSENKPKRTMLFIAFSGYWQGLAGSREFVDQYWDVLNRTTVHLNLDFSTDSKRVGLVWVGYYYRNSQTEASGAFALPWSELPLSKATLLWGKINLKEIEEKLGSPLPVDDTVSIAWERFFPSHFMSDVEPFLLAGAPAFSFRTTHSLRLRWNTPLDTPERINYENLKPQVEFSLCSIVKLANMMDEILPVYRLYRWYSSGGFSTIKGQVLEYDETIGWYKPVPHALVYLKLSVAPETTTEGVAEIVMGEAAWAAEFLQKIVIEGDENGSFILKGAFGVAEAGGAVLYGGITPRYYIAYAFVINDTTGAIEYAPDMGVYGAAKFPNIFAVSKEVFNRSVIVFKSGALVLFDYVDFRNIAMPYSTLILDIKGHVTPLHFGEIVSPDRVRMVFINPYEPIEIVVRDSQYQVVGLLNNSTRGCPSGVGFRVKPGETFTIYHTPAKMANDLYFLNRGRVERATEALSQGTLDFQQLSCEFLANEDLMREELQYDTAYGYSINALLNAVEAHRRVSSAIQDSILTVFYFSLLITVGVLLLERLLVHASGVRRIIVTGILYVTLIVILSTIHPGFILAENAPMIVFGSLILCMIFPTGVILFSNLASSLISFRRKVVGAHFVELSRTGMASAMFSMGIENMRKRKFRSILTLATIALLSFSLTMLTSVSGTSAMRATEIPGTARYEGLFIRKGLWEPIPEPVVDYLESAFSNCTLCPRMWYYPPAQSMLISGKSELFVERYVVFLALSPKEVDVTAVDETLTDGSWFLESDLYACIISSELADNLHVKVGDIVNVGGLELTVRGIFLPQAFSEIKELDQQSIVPIDSLAPSQYRITGIRVPAEWIIIVPYELGRQLNFNFYAIAIKIREVNAIEELASKLGQITEFYVYSGKDGAIHLYTRSNVYSIHGLETMMIPLGIGVLICLTTLLAAVYERTREIGTLSALGAAPRSISFSFLIEAVTIGTLGSILGYVPGIVANIILYRAGFLPPGFYPNVSSKYVIYTTLGMILISIVSVIYPAIKAAKAVTPSLERAWRIPTKPRGDEWSIPLPFNFKDKREVIGVLKFLEEYLKVKAADKSGAFMASDIRLEKSEETISLNMITQIRPYEAGVNQDTRITAIRSKDKSKYTFEIYLRRKTGLLHVWQRSNRRLMDELRKQFLLWRGLSPEEKKKYMSEE